MTKQARHAGSTADLRRKPRPRPLPRWLKESQELDGVARSRCLLILSVLSGEKPVTEAIEQSGITRQTYYNLETKALHAMLTALHPMAATVENGATHLSAAQIGVLEEKVQKLEQDKRRTERLLLLTRKSLKVPLTSARRRGRPPKDRSSIPSGKLRSLLSKVKAAPSGGSTSTTAGAGAS